jgi:UDP-N-acetylmuramoyl-L-alanyl-D-glutamate--2,6-diaminopimelate ligase
MGTINYRFGGKEWPAANTTPLPSELQRFLGRVVGQGAGSCVMEVSSHALALNRVDGVEFDVGVFTNLTQDHLDFHQTMGAYGAAKRSLFERLGASPTKSYPRHAVVNMDDPSGVTMARAARVPVLAVRLRGPADVYASEVHCTAAGSRFLLHCPLGTAPVALPLLGDYNVMNALSAAAVGVSQGVPMEHIRLGLEATPDVPGRMERIVGSRGVTVVVDYAHTEDALKKVLQTLRRIAPKRLITVFGCGGDRDRTKRPLMGEAAAAMSDALYITSDNPRSEEPERIALDVEVGVRRVRTDGYRIVLDREQAIADAVASATEGDIVLVAGKGHETYQILPDRTIPFDDRAVVRRLLGLSVPA